MSPCQMMPERYLASPRKLTCRGTDQPSAVMPCAGIKVAAAYEIWPSAVRTYNANLGTNHNTSDIRRLDFSDLPRGVSLVVGSPPCTEFSFSNRGGRGNIAEGLKDVVKFLEVVRCLKPTYWLMENVPRIASLLCEGLANEDHPLFAFRDLSPEVRVLDFSDFGLPQSRKRCLVGVFPFDRLESYAPAQRRATLGEVIDALSTEGEVIDPIWKIALPRRMLTEMEAEPVLTGEQLRMNREAKRFHPVYNDMPFPDAMDRPSRTITATCTRVSRESIVVPDKDGISVRRLKIRERASLQGFPISYQFFGSSHSQKVKMIGNAVPPLFAFLVGAAAQGWAEATVANVVEQEAGPLMLPRELPEITPPHAVGTKYPAHRRFRAALPGLRFKSGMRFELSNEFANRRVTWAVHFYFGTSKAVRNVALDARLNLTLQSEPWVGRALSECHKQLASLFELKGSSTADSLQEAWCRSSEGIGPYQVVDMLGHAAIALTNVFAEMPVSYCKSLVMSLCVGSKSSEYCTEKLSRHSSAVLAGLVLGCWFNCIPWGAEDSGSCCQPLTFAG